jgi:type I restriction enzyme S subunit
MSQRWTERPLGELFEIGAGKTMSAAAREGDGKVPFLRTSNVFWDRIDLTSLDEMAIPPRELAEKHLEPGDLLVCEGGEIGRAAIWEGGIEPMSFQNHLHRLRPKVNDVDPRFYVFFLQSAFTQLGIFEGAGNKTTIPNLSSSRLAALEVPHPPFAEQQAIVTLLASLREAEDLHSRLCSLSHDLKGAAMERVFRHGLNGDVQEESTIGLVPEGWIVEELSVNHSVQTGGTPARGNGSYWDGGTIPWVKTAEVTYSTIVETSEHITKQGLDESAAKMLPRDTVLLAMYGATRGKVAILGIDAATNQACAAIQPSTDAVDSRYLYHYLAYRYEDVRQMAHGGAQQNLSLDIVRKIPIAYPPDLAQQREIASLFDPIDDKARVHARRVAVIQELFKRLLHDLMTGEIGPEDFVHRSTPNGAGGVV